ncbi:MAG: hypothetical protein IM568_02620 [Flavobacterium sp.]|nr:hypothetical protein [Flavobacterium sp.]
MKYFLLFFTFINLTQGQKFIPLDEDTLEYISEANYNLYANKKLVFSSITSTDSVTRLPKNVLFDSISFSKLNYKETGLKKENLGELVRLKKIVYELEDVIISNSKNNQISIGEKSRFIKKYSNSIKKDTVYGLLFHKSDIKNKQIEGLLFYVEKVKYKTTYKIKFYAANENGNIIIGQSLELAEILFESPILTLETKTKNKVEVNLEEYNFNTENHNVFVCLELQAYYDENNEVMVPSFKESTKLKFQLSNFNNYYAKTIDFYTKEKSDSMININGMIKHDFATVFFRKTT